MGLCAQVCTCFKQWAGKVEVNRQSEDTPEGSWTTWSRPVPCTLYKPMGRCGEVDTRATSLGTSITLWERHRVATLT